MEQVRPTRAVVRILKAFLDDFDDAQYGYRLMQETGFSSAKVYQILARLHTAGWLDRFDDPEATPESGGPPRITYRLHGDAVRAARHMVAEAQREFAPTPKHRRARAALEALGVI